MIEDQNLLDFTPSSRMITLRTHPARCSPGFGTRLTERADPGQGGAVRRGFAIETFVGGRGKGVDSLQEIKILSYTVVPPLSPPRSASMFSDHY